MASLLQHVHGGILTEVPSSLKRLARLVVRGFYGVEHAIVIDLLVSHPCVKEDDLAELLRFERKHLRAIIGQLKADKLIKVRLRVETTADGKASKHNYYFINYKVFVNVVKYRLDHMRRRIEVEERDSTSRASFKCGNCAKSYTDLEVDRLFDFTTGEFRCSYCNTQVEEDHGSLPKKDARTLLARFNEQMQPIFDLMRDTEDMRLDQSILEPEPTNIESIRANMPNRGHAGMGQTRDPNQHVWSGQQHTGFQMYEQGVTVNVGDEQKKARDVEKKEQPIWMAASTVQGVSTIESESSMQFPAPESFAGPSAVLEGAPAAAVDENDDIMRALLAHEKKSAAADFPGSGNESDTSEEEDSKPQTSADAVADFDSDEDEEAVMVSIGNMRIPLDEVTEELVARMTAAEKETYIRIGQEAYSSMYD
ncbi:PREDICTED: general transcription factor IIE subunit 1-like [Priapulus caudatus]|uniref:General transcription factor IIE subunit 1-like n=1 Tax=Priapulus caudatus TaxID=37621 RepID=A0ABM1F0R1_PRICU|nr:PREDICTED: general transcription factor IIE subunit 1-like [Priapulus caudatus]